MPSNKRFFDKPQPAAILKHQVLFRYLKVFASKTGSQSLGQVHFVDGYAGAGTYRNGDLGSPGHALVVANQLVRSTRPTAVRHLNLTFVEADRETYTKLVSFIDSSDTTEIPEPLVKLGTIEEHLDAILTRAKDEPLFFFLDPFGVGIPFEMLTKKILGRSRNNRPKTEVLLNFSVQAVDRMGGMLHSEARNAAATLKRLDDNLGGDWWHAVYDSTTGAERMHAIASGYFQRVSIAAGGGWMGWTVPVADRFGKRPEYLLIHFTQHPDGRWEFHEALSPATAAWRAAVHELDPQPDPNADEQGAFDFPELDAPPPFEEDEGAWIEEIAKNARTLLANGPFVVQKKLTTLAGRALGMVRNKHFFAALKKCHDEGLLAEKPKSSGLQKATITPRPRP